MVKTNKFLAMVMISLMLCSATLAQNSTKRATNQAQARATAVPVTGSGTTGQITKWTSSSTIGDSTIFEDKFGKLGIGTTAPTSTLTVQGMIETTLGGFKFPDGTVQTSAGTTPGQVVTSLNGLKGVVQLMAGPNITLTANGSTLTIAAPTSLSAVNHDNTLTGDGTSALPLGIKLPLFLNADLPLDPVLFAGNLSTSGGIGVVGLGRVYGVQGGSNFGDGLHGESNTGNGVFGRANFKQAFAGKFEGFVRITSNNETDPLRLSPGNLVVTGLIAKGAGSFKIDHPLDPENKYLYHSFVESPDMKNIYDGVVKLDANGEAVIELPDWFEALNRDYRYLLTAIGAPAPSLYIAEKINNNRFKVAGGVSGMEVSWQVTGIRQDAFANAHRIKVEESKTKEERGYYLHPTEFGQPAEKSIERAPVSEQVTKSRENVQKQKLQ
jgi:hypothetical protein